MLGPIFKAVIKLASHKIVIVILSPVFVVLLLLLLIILSPLYLYRKIVMEYVRKYRPEFGKMVSAQSVIVALDDMHEKPECNVVIWFTLKGSVTVKEFQSSFKERVLNLRNPTNGLLVYPELRQYYENAFGFLFWKWDEKFDLNNHIKICDDDEIQNVHEYDTSVPLDESHLINVNEKLLSKPWPWKQSPWAFLLVPNYKTAGDTLVIFHLHHGMGDGFSFLKLIVGHLAVEMEMSRVAKSRTRTDQIPLLFPANKWIKIARNCVTFPFRIFYDLSEQLIDGYDIGPWHLPEKKLTRRLRVAKSNKIPISFIKEIKNLHEVSFTAVLLAATSGGLRNHFIEEGLEIPDSEWGMHVFIPWPFPNHPNDKLRNHLTGCLGKLPLGKVKPGERLQSCHRNFESMRESTIPLLNFYLSTLFGALPNFLKGLRKNYHASGLWGNFPGTEKHFCLCGREVTELSYNVATLHGRTGFAFTVLSYGEYVTIDLTIDEALAPSEESGNNLIRKIREEFDVLWKEGMRMA